MQTDTLLVGAKVLIKLYCFKAGVEQQNLFHRYLTVLCIIQPILLIIVMLSLEPQSIISHTSIAKYSTQQILQMQNDIQKEAKELHSFFVAP